MQNLTPEGQRLVAGIAARNGVSTDAATTLLDALVRGNGYQAQFNHPDLGGMGQWSQGGMIMVGDMFNQGLKYRVDALCNELANLLHSQPSLTAAPAQSQSQSGSGTSLFVAGSVSSGQWWPAELGSPSSTGAQNDMRYAFFPGTHRLAIQQGGHVSVYDAGDHQLTGFSQQQGYDQSLTFTSQYGVVRVADLPLVSATGQEESVEAPSPPVATEAAPTPRSQPEIPSLWVAPTPAPTTSFMADTILKTIESLAALREKNILTEEEFTAKKIELLSRL